MDGVEGEKGGYDVIAITMKRGGGGWMQIGVSQTASFTDVSPLLVPGQPEQRDYRVQGMLNNARVGGVSGTVSAVTVPKVWSRRRADMAQPSASRTARPWISGA